ncbi:FAS1-like dehydratase domain-containing protein [Azohydromonas australica]|uniref:FAS1-like dehydratase domain-containing protein n=1 Tax=Azohydromonas australica TaxID=364039 RepID=UPI0003F72485|nr:MaoC family dehydratase N-terminal domain-containing protein [Azohydromonas australica]
MQLRGWEGCSETLQEQIAEAPARGLAATLDLEAVPAGAEGGLPPLWHWLYFLPRAAQSVLNDDGHPRLGGFMPPVPLPRRMWAGGRLRWQGAVCLGDTLQRRSTIQSVAHKAGRSGDLVFVTLCHETDADSGTVLVEEQDIVYRAAPVAGEPLPAPQAAPRDAAWTRVITPDPTLLFRFSALTFNAHRIHYDRPYATEAEGYAGLIVHGPLLALLLAELARHERPQARVNRFEFRAVRPTTDLHPFRLCGEPTADGLGARLWAQDHEGWLTMQAEIGWAEEA